MQVAFDLDVDGFVGKVRADVGEGVSIGTDARLQWEQDSAAFIQHRDLELLEISRSLVQFGECMHATGQHQRRLVRWLSHLDSLPIERRRPQLLSRRTIEGEGGTIDRKSVV